MYFITPEVRKELVVLIQPVWFKNLLFNEIQHWRGHEDNNEERESFKPNCLQYVHTNWETKEPEANPSEFY